MSRGKNLAVRLLVALLVVGSVLSLKAWRDGRFSRIELPITELRAGVQLLTVEKSGDAQHAAPGTISLPIAPDGNYEFPQNPGFLGAGACRECHAELTQGWEATAHARTGQIVSEADFPGSFEPGQNRVSTRHPGLEYEVLRSPDGTIRQKVTLERDGKVYTHSESIDIVLGSSKLGQTYLFWKGSALYELPVSWFQTSHAWVNSPGYRDDAANFARPAIAECVLCHATWLGHAAHTPNVFSPQGMILGVSCERCHGPGQTHVSHRNAGQGEPGDPIVNPSQLSRELQIELCSQCHSGAPQLITPAFSFRPGDRVKDHLSIPDVAESDAGVHSANQQKRLSQSKCYQNSPQMTCTTCHDPHHQERGNAVTFADHCRKCHENRDCAVVVREGTAAENRCVECHMPLAEDDEMGMATVDAMLKPLLRDHLIRVDRVVNRKNLKK